VKSANEVYEARILRAKDKVRACQRQEELARLEAGRIMLEAVGKQVRRTNIAAWWNTSTQQVDRMMARARVEK